MAKPVLELDGARIDSLQGFFEEVSRSLIPGASWGRNLDAFNDILRGGFGTPEGGFVLRWRGAERSRRALGHEETARWLERGMSESSADHVAESRRRLLEAQQGQGETLFDTLVEIIRAHGANGPEAGDGVELELA